jgi:hypothetical protein
MTLEAHVTIPIRPFQIPSPYPTVKSPSSGQCIGQSYRVLSVICFLLNERDERFKMRLLRKKKKKRLLVPPRVPPTHAQARGLYKEAGCCNSRVVSTSRLLLLADCCYCNYVHASTVHENDVSSARERFPSRADSDQPRS